jgi:hypothetical protein
MSSGSQSYEGLLGSNAITTRNSWTAEINANPHEAFLLGRKECDRLKSLRYLNDS